MATPTPIIFDIETGPLADDQLRRLIPPFDPSKIKDVELIDKPFDPSTVKYGNTTDEEKRTKKLAVDTKKYDDRVAEAKEKLAGGEDEHWQKFKDKAALSATTGRVLAIGCFDKKPLVADGKGSEKALICSFWSCVERLIGDGRHFIGFNIFDFDLPFLMRRMWIHKTQLPLGMIERNRYWNDSFIDLMQVWCCGVRGERIGLDALAKALDVGGKPDDVSGADFYKWWFGTPKEKKAAREYLINDLKMTQAVAQRLGVA